MTPLVSSLNPADMGTALGDVPQHHYAGADDKIVPPSIAQSYMARLPSRRCAVLHVVAGAGHHEGWEKNWPVFNTDTPACR